MGAEVLVIGAGISGLTTALSLAEAGAIVEVIAERAPHDTVSVSAGAVWGPYAVSDDPNVLRWSIRTLRRLRLAALNVPPDAEKDSGVSFVPGLEAARTSYAPPSWARYLPDFVVVRDPGDLPGGFVSGWTYSVPVVHMPSYLAYLQRCLSNYSVRIHTGHRLDSLEELRGAADYVVNCTGLGARDLVPDKSVSPVKGQLVIVSNPGIQRFFSDFPESEQPTYFMPQGKTVVMGGTILAGQDDLTIDDKVTAAIQRRCAEVEPLLRDAEVLDVRVGLRPSRPRVRVERVDDADLRVIHNYGHGGSGVTFSWGCAQDVLSLLD